MGLLDRFLPQLTSALQPVPLVLSWPGAGVLVFWQLGVLKGLASRYDLHQVPMLGSSSGALVCAMAKSGACIDTAVDRGLELLRQYGVTDRSWGLVGILGRLTRHWLQDVLPSTAAERCSAGAATLLVTTLPLLRTRPVTDFKSKQDLIDVVMASSHIPIVVDWRMWVSCRWRPCIDGGIWWLLQRSKAEYRPQHAQRTLLVTPFDDPHVVKDLHILRKMRPSDLAAAHQLVDMGLNFADMLATRHQDLFTHLAKAGHAPVPEPSSAAQLQLQLRPQQLLRPPFAAEPQLQGALALGGQQHRQLGTLAGVPWWYQSVVRTERRRS